MAVVHPCASNDPAFFALKKVSNPVMIFIGIFNCKSYWQVGSAPIQKEIYKRIQARSSITCLIARLICSSHKTRVSMGLGMVLGYGMY